MIALNEVLKTIEKYSDTYRHPNLPEYKISKPYSLFPIDSSDPENSWPYCWPYVHQSGVYLILNSNKELLYIGKSSVSIGSRLSSHFKFANDKSCRIVHGGWSEKPYYIVAVAVPDDSKFESASLEEYLIQAIATPDNRNLIK